MKQYLLLFIISVFWSFTNEKVTILNNTNHFDYISIRRYINIISIDKESSDIYLYYAFNPQSCQLREKIYDNDTKICYVSLLFNETWYYFCSKINMTDMAECEEEEKKKSFVDCCKDRFGIEEYFNETNDTYKDNKLQIDCYGKNLRYLNILPLIILIFLI